MFTVFVLVLIISGAFSRGLPKDEEPIHDEISRGLRNVQSGGKVDLGCIGSPNGKDCKPQTDKTQPSPGHGVDSRGETQAIDIDRQLGESSRNTHRNGQGKEEVKLNVSTEKLIPQERRRDNGQNNIKRKKKPFLKLHRIRIGVNKHAQILAKERPSPTSKSTARSDFKDLLDGSPNTKPIDQTTRASELSINITSTERNPETQTGSSSSVDEDLVHVDKESQNKPQGHGKQNANRNGHPHTANRKDLPGAKHTAEKGTVDKTSDTIQEHELKNLKKAAKERNNVQGKKRSSKSPNTNRRKNKKKTNLRLKKKQKHVKKADKVPSTSSKDTIDTQRETKLEEAIKNRGTAAEQEGVIKDRGTTAEQKGAIKENRDDNVEREEDNKKDSDAASDDRWSRKGLKQVPDVARLERRLHPTVNAPVQDISRALQRMLQYLQDSTGSVERHYYSINNATRWNTMISIRKELTSLAEENDKIYGVVIDTSLLTKEIYLRAHEQRRQGYRRPVAQAVAVYSKEHRLASLPLKKVYEDTQRELQEAQRLKRSMEAIIRRKMDLQFNYLRVRRILGERVQDRAWHDLHRHAQQTIRTLQMSPYARDTGDRTHLISHMKNDSYSLVSIAKTMCNNSRSVLEQVKKTSMNNKKHSDEVRHLLRSHGGHDVQADMGFDESRMVLWAAVDNAKFNADKLFMEAAKLHMLLSGPVLRAKEIIKSRQGGTFSGRLNSKAQELKQQLKTLSSVMDSIRFVLGEKRFLRDPCDILEGSGSSWTDDEMDCDDRLPVGSGDDDDGSGDIDGDDPGISSIDPTISGVKEPLTKQVDVDITASANKTDEIPDVHHTDVDITNINKQPSTKTSSKPPAVEKVSALDGTDDEDLIKEITSKSKSKATTTPTKQTSPEVVTTTAAPLVNEDTKEGAEDDDGFVFTDWFGLLSDEPVRIGGEESGRLVEISSDTVGLSATRELSFNEFIRQRLSNYSSVSRAVMETAKSTRQRADELALTWTKIKARAEALENRTMLSRSFVSKWRAEQASFSALHDRIESVTDDITFKSGVQDTQCAAAVEKAEKKLESFQVRYKKETQQQDQAADPGDINQMLESVTSVKRDVSEIAQLTQMMPCKTLRRLDRAIRSNISELRKKIEKAKLLASSLQISVKSPKDSYLTLPVTKGAQSPENSATFSLEAMVKSDAADGTVMVMQTTNMGSVVVAIEDNYPKLIVLDKGDYKEDEATADVSMDTDVWYKFLYERFAQVSSLNIYTVQNESLVAHVNVSADGLPVLQPAPDNVYLGGGPKDLIYYTKGLWQGCIGNVSTEGQTLNVFVKDSKGNMATGCSSLIPAEMSAESLRLEGTGYGFYDLPTLMESPRIRPKNMHLTFTAQSDGTLIKMRFKQWRINGEIRIVQGKMLVFMQSNNYEASLVAAFKEYNKKQHILIRFETGRVHFTLNGQSDIFKSSPSKITFSPLTDDGLFIGGTKEANSSMEGCLTSLSVNDRGISLYSMTETNGVHAGQCRKQSCVTFTEASEPVRLQGLDDAKQLYVTVKYGSLGPVLQYSKYGDKEKFNVSIVLSHGGVDITESVGDQSERLDLPEEEFTDGDDVIITVEDKDDEVSVSARGSTVSVDYEKGGGGWFTNKKDEATKYHVAVGTSTEFESTFTVGIRNLIVGDRPISLSTYAESNKLHGCIPRPNVNVPAAVETTSSPELEC